jgi:hypothetical protein
MFQSFTNDFDDDDYRPELSDEWLNPIELQQRVTTQEEQRKRVLNSLNNAGSAQQNQLGENAANNETAAPAEHRAHEVQPQTPSARITIPEANEMPSVEIETPPTPTAVSEPTADQQTRRYPLRNRKPTKRLIKDEEFGLYSSPCNWIFMGKALINKWRTTQSDYRYIVALLTSVDTLGLEGVHPAIAQFPAALKASKKDPDSPSFQEAMTGPYREQFLEAMRTKVNELESHQCWDVVAATNVPEGAKILPTMWVFKIK